jgi:WD40 repeat protein
VYSASPSASGLLVASADDTGFAIWDVPSREPLPALPNAFDRADEVSLSYDGRYLAARKGLTVKIWDREDRRNPGPKMFSGQASALAFAPGSDTLAVATTDCPGAAASYGSSCVVLWTWNKGRIESASIGGAVNELAFSPDGGTLAVAGDGLTLLQLDADTLVGTCPLDGEALQDVAVSRDGESVAAVGRYNEAWVWDRARGCLYRRDPLPQGAAVVAFSEDGTFATGGQDGTIEIRRRTAGADSTLKVAGHPGSVADLIFSQDGRSLTSAGLDGTVILWRVTGDRSLSVLRPFGSKAVPTQSIDDLAYLSATQLVVAGYGQVVVHDRGSHRVRALPGPPKGRLRLAVSPANGGTVAAIAQSSAERIVIWQHVAGRTIRISRQTKGDSPLSIAFSPDGRLAAGTEQGAVFVWDLDRASFRRIPTDLRRLKRIAFDRSGSRIAAGSKDGNVIVLDSQTGDPLAGPHKMNDVVTSLAFSPKDDTLAIAAVSDIELWVPGGRTVKLLQGSQKTISDVVFTADGETLASSTESGDVMLWHVRQRKSLGEALHAESGRVNAIDFRPDEGALAVAGIGGAVALWDDRLWKPDEAITSLCAIVGTWHGGEDWRELLPAGSSPATC